MRRSGKIHDVAYVQLQPVWNRYRNYVSSFKAVKVSQGPPRAPQAGCITVKLRLSVPVSAFEPLEARGVIEASHAKINVVSEPDEKEDE